MIIQSIKKLVPDNQLLEEYAYADGKMRVNFLGKGSEISIG